MSISVCSSLEPRASCPVKRLSGTRLLPFSTHVYLLSWLITVGPIARFISSRSEPTGERIRSVRHLLDCEPPRRVVLHLREIRFSLLQSVAFWFLDFFAVINAGCRELIMTSFLPILSAGLGFRYALAASTQDKHCVTTLRDLLNKHRVRLTLATWKDYCPRIYGPTWRPLKRSST